MLKEITDTINPDVYHKLFYYISEAYDIRPSIAKQIISELPDFIEKRIKELDEPKVTVQLGPISPIPANFGPVPETIDSLY